MRHLLEDLWLENTRQAKAAGSHELALFQLHGDLRGFIRRYALHGMQVLADHGWRGGIKDRTGLFVEIEHDRQRQG